MLGAQANRCVSRCPRPLAPARVLRPTWLARHTAVKCRRGVERAAARHPRAAAGCRSDAHHRPDASRPLSDRSRHRRTRAGVRLRDARARATARSRARRRAAALLYAGTFFTSLHETKGQHAADRPALSGARDRDDSPWPSSPTPQSTISPGARRIRARRHRLAHGPDRRDGHRPPLRRPTTPGDDRRGREPDQ